MKPDPPRGSTQMMFGLALRQLRGQAGLSLRELGKRALYDYTRLSRAENGEILIPAGKVRLLDEVLHVGGLLVTLRAAASPGAEPGLTRTVARDSQRDDGEDPVHRRQLLANLILTAAATASGPLPGREPAAGEVPPGELLAERVRDAMLGLPPAPALISPGQLRAGLAAAMTGFHSCRYRSLARVLPRLIASGHHAAAQAPGDADTIATLAQVYTLTTRMLIKLDDQQLGWMAADRASVLATAAADPLVTAETARNLAVLARKAGWHDQALSIALQAAGHPALRGADPHLIAERGLLIQSAAYSAARSGDRAAMRELTAEAAALAARLGSATLLRDHGGGFSPATVQLHRISAEHYAGEPGAALAAARRINPASLPSLPSPERRARYYTDIARACGQAGRRDDCLSALLAAERHAPEETHSRPAIRDLITGLLLSGRTSPELRGLAARSGIT
jgi:transcriptional regulator with XRE-family HTH domain